MWKEFRPLISLLNDPDANPHQVKLQIAAFKKRYETLYDYEISNILQFNINNRADTIFLSGNSIISDGYYTSMAPQFLEGMVKHPELAPVDFMIEDHKFRSENFQFNVHRSLYNSAFLIPQNSLAAVVNAYVVGIRSVELDVLSTKDNVPVIIHDLVTNRLEGNFAGPPELVEKHTYAELKDTKITVLNPLACPGDKECANSNHSTGVNHILPLAKVIATMNDAMPEMTLYLDARNDAPVSVLALFHGWKNTANPASAFVGHTVLKVYPFKLSQGAGQLAELFQQQVGLPSRNAALDALQSLQPNLLLVMGGVPANGNELMGQSGLSHFTFGGLEQIADKLPYARASKYPCQQGVAPKSCNNFNNSVIFTDNELLTIEANTWKMVRWAADFSAYANVSIYQVAMLPSMVGLVDSGEAGKVTFEAMNQNEKQTSAAMDNFEAAYGLIMNGEFDIVLYSPDRNHLLSTRIAHTRFGLSDRYPDYQVAHFSGDGDNRPKDDSISNGFYSMLGTVYRKDDFGTRQSHSSAATLARIAELKTLWGIKAGYMTTDLPVDLRAGQMGLLTHDGKPIDINYRVGALVKPRFAPVNYAHTALSPWSVDLYGSYHLKYGNVFGTDMKSLSLAHKSYEELRVAELTFEGLRNPPPFSDNVAMNATVLSYLGCQAPCSLDRFTKEKLDTTSFFLAQMTNVFKNSYEYKLIRVSDAYGIDAHDLPWSLDVDMADPDGTGVAVGIDSLWTH